MAEVTIAAGLPQPEIDDAGGCVTVRFRHPSAAIHIVAKERVAIADESNAQVPEGFKSSHPPQDFAWRQVIFRRRSTPAAADRDGVGSFAYLGRHGLEYLVEADPVGNRDKAVGGVTRVPTIQHELPVLGAHPEPDAVPTVAAA